jgi:FtsP/CotA-like multicopper oxidase with cupredoxin domain
MRAPWTIVLFLCAGAIHASESAWVARVRAQNGDAFALESIVPREDGRRAWSYRMTIVETEHRLTDGIAYKVWAYGGTVPAPLLVVREGDVMRIRVTNETSVAHTIHSHGLFVPQRMDGVPHRHGAEPADPHAAHRASLPAAIEPGATFVYEYVARPAGTHWYHCHVNTNEHMKRGMAGALIVLPREAEPAVDREEVLLLQEWNTRYAKGGQPGHPREGGDADVFTINGRSFPDTQTLRAEVGDTVRLRVINGGSQFHSMHLHGHSFLVTHKDGAPLAEPTEIDTVAVGPGERVDLVVDQQPGEWPLHCHDTAHQTNGGYPGGMMMHLLVGPSRRPRRARPGRRGSRGGSAAMATLAHARLFEFVERCRRDARLVSTSRIRSAMPMCGDASQPSYTPGTRERFMRAPPQAPERVPGRPARCEEFV